MSRHSVEPRSQEWSADELEALHTLWAEGLSSQEIGRRINRSKNAVLGKVHRLGLAGRPSPLILTYGPPRPPKQKPLPQYYCPPRQRGRPIVVRTKPKPAVIPPVIPPPANDAVAPELPPELPAWVWWEGPRCQWPLNNGRPWRLCEAPVRGRRVYCPIHQAVAHPKAVKEVAA